MRHSSFPLFVRRLSAQVKATKGTAIIEALAAGEGDVSELLELAEETKDGAEAAPSGRNKRNEAQQVRDKAVYVHDLGHRMGLLKAFLTKQPEWKSAVKARQQTRGRWSSLRRGSVAKVMPDPSAASFAEVVQRAAAAATAIQVRAARAPCLWHHRVAESLCIVHSCTGIRVVHTHCRTRASTQAVHRGAQVRQHKAEGSLLEWCARQTDGTPQPRSETDGELKAELEAAKGELEAAKAEIADIASVRAAAKAEVESLRAQLAAARSGTGLRDADEGLRGRVHVDGPAATADTSTDGDSVQRRRSRRHRRRSHAAHGLTPGDADAESQAPRRKRSRSRGHGRRQGGSKKDQDKDKFAAAVAIQAAQRGRMGRKKGKAAGRRTSRKKHAKPVALEVGEAAATETAAALVDGFLAEAEVAVS